MQDTITRFKDQFNEAVIRSPFLIPYLKDDALSMLDFKQIVSFVKHQTPKIIQAALNQNIWTGQHIDRNKFPDLYENWQWIVNKL